MQQPNIAPTEQVLQVTPVQGGDLYAPSSVEKKRALIMYFLFGIMIVMANKKANAFEYFHLKQAIGRWIVFMLFLIVSLFLLFLPLLKFVGILLLIVMVVIFVIFSKQAWDGKYSPNGKSSLAVFSGLGTWLLGLFDVQIENTDPNIQNEQQVIQPPIQG